MTPGAVAYGLGLSRELSMVIQYASMGLAILAVVFAAFRLASVPSYLVAVVASQLLSPILWDHYALLLLLPVAWMLDRGRWWAIAIPLATSVVLVGWIPAWVYPLAFWATLVGVIGVGLTRGRGVLVGRVRAARPGGVAGMIANRARFRPAPDSCSPRAPSPWSSGARRRHHRRDATLWTTR